MIYVDKAEWKKSPNGRKNYAHMTADSLDELHDFAVKIGVKKHFFHKSKSGWHYDITEVQLQKALENNAKQINTKELQPKAKALISR